MDDNKVVVSDNSDDTKTNDDQVAGQPENSPVEPAASEASADKAEDSESTEVSEPLEVAATPEPSDESKSETESETSDKSDKSEPAESSEPESEISQSEVDSERLSDTATPTGKKAHWYVVHTYSGHEAKVAATLKQRIESQKVQDKILDILVPTQEKIEIKEGKKNKVNEKIFPGYLLIRMVLDDETWLAVRTTPGITSFVGNANKPTPLSDSEVISIKRFMSMEAPKFKTAFSIGEAVKIIEGPFAEFLGSISEIDEEKGKLKVMVSIFGRETPVELDFLQVNKL